MADFAAVSDILLAGLNAAFARWSTLRLAVAHGEGGSDDVAAAKVAALIDEVHEFFRDCKSLILHFPPLLRPNASRWTRRR
jgi:hypothetical protein